VKGNVTKYKLQLCKSKGNVPKCTDQLSSAEEVHRFHLKNEQVFFGMQRLAAIRQQANKTDAISREPEERVRECSEGEETRKKHVVSARGEMSKEQEQAIRSKGGFPRVRRHNYLTTTKENKQ
jgi:hypothetical protein